MSITDHQVDARNLYCPEPVMLLHKAVREVREGQLIVLLATDPSTERDVPKFCHFLGHELLEHLQEGELFRYVIRRKSPVQEISVQEKSVPEA